MGQELIILRGLPGSGKTTWALRHLVEHADAVRVNRDELRLMLHGDRPRGAEDEAVTMRARDASIVQALLLGRTVISDDTNLEPYHLQAMRALADPLGVAVRVVVVDTPIEECIRRDAARALGVGAERIWQMAARLQAARRAEEE